MTIRQMWIGTVAALALAASAPGCTQGDTPEQSAESAALTAQHTMHGPPGPELLLSEALQNLDLTAEQRTTIESAAHAIGPGVTIDPATLADLAAGVRAGHLDEAKVLAKLGAAPSSDRAASVGQALDTLHTTLTAEQRRALVDLIAKHMDEHEAAHDATHAGANPMIDHVLSSLALSSDQRASIDAIVAKEAGASPAMTADAVHAVHADLAARLQTFASDHFDGAGFATAVAASPMNPHDHVQRMVRTVDEILPVLTPAQRESLAAHLEAMPMHGG